MYQLHSIRLLLMRRRFSIQSKLGVRYVPQQFRPLRLGKTSRVNNEILHTCLMLVTSKKILVQLEHYKTVKCKNVGFKEYAKLTADIQICMQNMLHYIVWLYCSRQKPACGKSQREFDFIMRSYNRNLCGPAVFQSSSLGANAKPPILLVMTKLMKVKSSKVVIIYS